MSQEIIDLVLYPVKNTDLLFGKKEAIIRILSVELKSFSEEQLDNSLEKKDDEINIIELAGNIENNKKQNYFDLTKQIMDTINYSKDEIIRIAEVGAALNIDSDKTGFSFDIYNTDQINSYEYKKCVRNFSMISAAIGFIPLPIADYFILSPLQIAMITKISNIYEYKLEPAKFLKMVGGILGTGLILKITSKIISNLIPIIGWGVNASIAYCGTYAMGILAKRYIEANGELTEESIKTIWENSYKDGKEEFETFKDFIFQKKDELIAEFKKNIDKNKEQEQEKPSEKKSTKRKTTKKKTNTENETDKTTETGEENTD